MKIFSDTIQVVIFYRENDTSLVKFLILKRSEEDEVYPNIWQICTGTSIGDETALQTSIREVKEETGIQDILNIWVVPQVATYYSLRRDGICFSPIFAFEVKEDQEVKISDEHTDYFWVDFEKAQNLLLIPSYKYSLNTVKEYILNEASSNLFHIEHNKNII
jgi:dATP pyrophosphohydrolase